MGDLREQSTCDPEALVDLERAVDLRVVDESLPADSCSRLLKGTPSAEVPPSFLTVPAYLLKVGPHDHDELREALRLLPQERCVFTRLGGVVDGARANDDDDPVRGAGEDVGNSSAGGGDDELAVPGEGELGAENCI